MTSLRRASRFPFAPSSNVRLLAQAAEIWIADGKHEYLLAIVRQKAERVRIWVAQRIAFMQASFAFRLSMGWAVANQVNKSGAGPSVCVHGLEMRIRSIP
jgi:hypothetical protein